VRRGLLFALIVAASGCGRSPATTTNDECMSFSGQELNATTGSCLGAPVSVDGLSVCHDPGEAQGHGVAPICAVSAAGRLFKGQISSTQWLEGTGWTLSSAWGLASTLSADDEKRCRVALDPATPACP
jgi:hypothetical protein